MSHEKIVSCMHVSELSLWYKEYCKRRGLKDSSINLYMKICPSFVQALCNAGADIVSTITAEHVIKASLVVKSNYYLSAISTFFNVMSKEGLTVRNYAYVLPYFKRPQPIPTVYSPEEIRRVELAINKSNPCGRRNYAILLLSTRLGIRAGDISKMTFDSLDFETETIHLIQQKTGAPLTLPMLSEIKAALLDYINNERIASDSSYVFLCLLPPYLNVSVQTIWKMSSRALKAAGINTSGKKRGTHAFRSSLASSMVNDNVPYEAVRNVLGHSGLNAIKSYARLDTERLKPYALEVPAATGNFATFLTGGVSDE